MTLALGSVLERASNIGIFPRCTAIGGDPIVTPHVLVLFAIRRLYI